MPDAVIAAATETSSSLAAPPYDAYRSERAPAGTTGPLGAGDRATHRRHCLPEARLVAQPRHPAHRWMNDA